MQREILSGYRVGKPDGGPECEALERELEAYYGVPYARVFNSATSALHAAVVAIDPEPVYNIRYVMVPVYSMSATAACVLHAGCVPAFQDIDDDYAMSKNALDLKNRVPAVVAHLFGHHATLPPRSGVVIHDCAQSPSLRPDTRRQQDIWVFSLNQHKVVSCGEGGYALTFDRRLADRMHAVRNHGEVFTDDIVGHNYRMTEPEARIARRELCQLDDRLAARRQWADDLRTRLDIKEDRGNRDYFLYCVRYPASVRNAAALKYNGKAGYHRLIPSLPYFAAHGYDRPEDWPNATLIEREIVVFNPEDAGL